ncbi:MAG: transcription elongation factor GreA [Oscillospiraceae bacterium]|nr:transcription elongation factor GreA [Oscillospiraceae bacterium]
MANPANSNRYKMSRERKEALEEELHYLETERAREVAEQIKEARSYGDLSENSEYDEAKSEQGKLYSKIAELRDLVENAEIVDDADHDAPKDTVTLSSVVVIRDLEDEIDETYTIVGSQDADPMAGRISDDSPLGKGLIGHRAGDKITISAPAGDLAFEIVSVKN